MCMWVWLYFPVGIYRNAYGSAMNTNMCNFHWNFILLVCPAETQGLEEVRYQKYERRDACAVGGSLNALDVARNIF